MIRPKPNVWITFSTGPKGYLWFLFYRQNTLMVPFLKKRKTKIGCPIFVCATLLHDEEAATFRQMDVKTGNDGLYYTFFVCVLL